MSEDLGARSSGKTKQQVEGREREEMKVLDLIEGVKTQEKEKFMGTRAQQSCTNIMISTATFKQPWQDWGKVNHYHLDTL